ncbi:uncharacterized protein FA14DRAFT_180337 [Meira miltonrushii]|uniref:GRAM domain-containing protein n=1 Tax=Meira miltonrushii TaxID=1280837 RepID=A0A316VCI8_9BASI|nr:uncharacterized protein FA14DRAFT_180337 [Meira miltonrushii]PWN33701.1 hypothetical protein FA14DRAFT_180337 [Meira miltonrushii]
MSNKSPRKAQWGMHQHRHRRDPSPSGAQWDASITLRAVQSESLQMRNPSNVSKYPPSPTSTTFSSASYNTLPSTMMTTNTSSTSTSNRTTMSNSTDPPIGQQAINLRGRPAGFHSYSLSVDTAKAQQQTALGLFRSTEATSPTSTTGSQYHYWRGGDSPVLMKGSEPPFNYAERRPSWTQENVSSTRRGAPLLSPTSTSFDQPRTQHKRAESHSNPLDNIKLIEQEAKALMLLRSESGQKSEKNAPVKPLRISSRMPEGVTDYSSAEKEGNKERVRFDDSRPTAKRSLTVEPTPTSRPSFFKKAFGSPLKKTEKEAKEERRTTQTMPTTRSIVRNSHSSSSLRQKSKQRDTLTRMISAPTLIETSSTASPVQTQMQFPQNDRKETLPKAEDSIAGLNGNQPKRRKRAPPPPPPRRKHSENSTNTQSSRSPISPLSPSEPLTPPEEKGGDIAAIVGYSDEAQFRKNSASTIRKNSAVHMTEDFSLIGHMPLDFINGVGKERKFSNTESLGSIYDQESWAGHTPQENELALPSPTYQHAKLSGGKNRGRKKSDLSPLVKDRIVELQEPDTSIDTSDTSNESQQSSSHLLYLDEIRETRRRSQVKDDRRATVYEDADSGLASNEESLNAESDSESPIIVKRRPSEPRYYKIVRTTDEDSNELEYLDSIHLYDEESQSELTEESSSVTASSIERANSSLTTAEQEEINRFVKNYGKNIRSVRASALMDLDDAAQRPSSIEKVWQERQEGKRNVISFVLATISGTMTYLTPIKFKDIHQIRNYNNINESDHQVEQFHMESLKDNCERLFLASVPMYEMLFTRLWHISHWSKKLESLSWFTAYFTLWYCDALIPGALAILIFKIVNERESGRKRGSMLTSEELQSRSKMLEQFSEGVKIDPASMSSSATSSPTLAGDENSFTSSSSEVTNALRQHTQAISNFTAKVADIHERMYNMSRWSYTPATVRTLIIVGFTMAISLFFNASQILHCVELIFGVHFFILVPILSRFKSLSGKANFSIFSLFDFALSGVPNDAQNALLIMRKSNANESDRESKQSRDKRKCIAEFDDVVIQPAHARGGRYRTKEDSPTKMTWAAKETTFTATYDDQVGLLMISSKRILFRTGGPSFIVLLDIELEQIAQLDKVRKATIKDSIRNEGLRITVKQDFGTNTEPSISIHTFLNMNLRDEAFNRVLALAPQRWHKQIGVNSST